MGIPRTYGFKNSIRNHEVTYTISSTIIKRCPFRPFTATRDEERHS